MRISKKTAHEIAEKALLHKKKVVKESREIAVDYITKLVKLYTPSIVSTTFSRHEKFFKKSSSFRFKSEDNLDYTYYSAISGLPTESEWISISKLELAEVQRIHRVIVEREGQYENDLKNLTTALIQLSTTKRIVAELPELEKFLPLPTSSTLVPNIDKIRELIR